MNPNRFFTLAISLIVFVVATNGYRLTVRHVADEIPPKDNLVNSVKKEPFKDSKDETLENGGNSLTNEDIITDEPPTETTSIVEASSTTEDANVITEKPTDEKEPDTEWITLWRDDFNGEEGTLPNEEEWIFDIGTSYEGGPPYWGNKEVQYYTDDPDNVSVDGHGNLRITPRRDSNGNWTSARIETKRTDFKPVAGGVLAIEGRIRMPDVTGRKALGYWPAFWALGNPLRGNYQNWPEIGEFDIMENVNGLNAVWGVLHCGLAPNDPCQENNGLSRVRPCPGSSCQSDFHTYRFEWDDSKTPKEFRWYVDGEQYHRVTSDKIDDASFHSMTGHSGYFILLNVAMGGSFPNGQALGRKTPTKDTEPNHSMLVDYVAVYTTHNKRKTTTDATTF